MAPSNRNKLGCKRTRLIPRLPRHHLLRANSVPSAGFNTGRTTPLWYTAAVAADRESFLADNEKLNKENLSDRLKVPQLVRREA